MPETITSHTPGPWHWVNPETDEPREAGEWRSSLRTVAEFGENKTEVRDGLSYTSWALPKFILEADEIMYEQMDANARLIAAAPCLLAALQGCIPQLELGNGEAEHIKAARAAIAKATGAPDAQ